MPPSLRPLLDLISTHDFEEYGWLLLESAEWAGNEVLLRLVLRQQDQPDQRWSVRGHSVLDGRISRSRGIDGLRVETEHALLLPHISPVLELYFDGRPASADAVVGQLVEAHCEVVGNWFDCRHFFNLGAEGSLRGLLAGGFGKLAEGPQPLIEGYARVLEAEHVRVSSPPARTPVRWDGQRWVDQHAQLFVVLLGESWFVTPHVTAERD